MLILIIMIVSNSKVIFLVYLSFLEDTLEYQKPFSIVELIVHKKYKTKLIKSQRVDYDIALLRLDYPIVDEISGIYKKLLISTYC